MASTLAVNYACRRYHYAKTVPLAMVSYSVFNDTNEWCGVIVYGLGAIPNIARPYFKWQGQVVELVRVALNGKQGQTSQVVGLSLKMLKKDAPLVDLVVSYADVDQEHLGVIYQATNWVYTGITQEGKGGYFIIHGKKRHGRSLNNYGFIQSVEWLRLNVDPNAEVFTTKGKHKYLMPLNRKMRKQIEPLRKPYPKRPKQGDDSFQENSGGATPTRTLQNPKGDQN